MITLGGDGGFGDHLKQKGVTLGGSNVTLGGNDEAKQSHSICHRVSPLGGCVNGYAGRGAKQAH